MLNVNPLDIAKQKASRQNNGVASSFFAMNDGESKVIRFITGLVPYTVISHSCGANLLDVRTDLIEECKSAGVPMKCPACGEPLSEEDLLFERPSILGVDMHRFVQTSDPSKRSSFVCLESTTNAAQGIVEANADGSPKWSCPICSSAANINKNTGKPKRPSYRVWGIAVEREAQISMENNNGRQVPTTVGINDVMVTDDDGNTHPKVVVLDMGYKNFWSRVEGALQSPDYSQSICDYDWRVTRIGAAMDTTYDIQIMNQGNPQPVDYRIYEPFVPDIKKMLSNMGAPSYYHKNGYPVNGYTPPAEDSAPTAQAPMQQPVQAPVQQPVQPPVQQVPMQQTAQMPNGYAPNQGRQLPNQQQQNLVDFDATGFQFGGGQQQ